MRERSAAQAPPPCATPCHSGPGGPGEKHSHGKVERVNGEVGVDFAIARQNLQKVVNQIVNRASKIVKFTLQSCESTRAPARKL